MNIILGLNGVPLHGHDPAAALIIDNHLVAAVEEERLCRKKRGMGLPPAMSAMEVVRLAGISPLEVEGVAIPWRPDAMGYDTKSLEMETREWLNSLGFRGKDVRISFIEHHASHAWSGLGFVQINPNEKYAILVIDGSGESTGGAAFRFSDELTCDWHIEQSSSLGIYYEAVTHYVGFSWGMEGKTMGLAAYGRPSGLCVPPIPDNRIPTLNTWSQSLGSPKHRHEKYRESFIREYVASFGESSTFNQRADISFAAQDAVYERILKYIDEIAQDVNGLILTGGVALNCAINADVADYCSKRGITFSVPPPASDTGVAIGAAIGMNFEYNHVVIERILNPYLGRSYTRDEIADKLKSLGVIVESINNRELARMLFEDNSIIGWFDGKSEVGPRALGKRCIIARPDSTRIRDKINVLKGRESWRPLAPSITEVAFNHYFRGSTPSKYMLINAINVLNKNELAGVTHVDGTARPQVVTEEGPYLDLLHEVGNISNCESIICTSFNMAGEPIVYSPENALLSARRMGLTAIAGNGWIVRL